MEKSNKKITIAIICAVIVLAVTGVAIWLIVKNNGSPSDSSTSQTDSDARVTADELLTTTPTVEIAYGDFDAMQALSKDIQNGKMTGKIVSIDGLVNHPGSAYSIVQKSADGTTKIGTVFLIDDSTSYPADDTRITVVAKVVEVSPLNFQLVTLKNFVKEK